MDITQPTELYVGIFNFPDSLSLFHCPRHQINEMKEYGVFNCDIDKRISNCNKIKKSKKPVFEWGRGEKKVIRDKKEVDRGKKKSKLLRGLTQHLNRDVSAIIAKYYIGGHRKHRTCSDTYCNDTLPKIYPINATKCRYHSEYKCGDKIPFPGKGERILLRTLTPHFNRDVSGIIAMYCIEENRTCSEPGCNNTLPKIYPINVTKCSNHEYMCEDNCDEDDMEYCEGCDTYSCYDHKRYNCIC
jgi:hypothetical protein